MIAGDYGAHFIAGGIRNVGKFIVGRRHPYEDQGPRSFEFGHGTSFPSGHTSVLFEQIYVDPARLTRRVQLALQRRSQLGLAQLVEEQPLEQGLAELVTYLSLSNPGFTVVFDEQQTEQVHWRDLDGRRRAATLPRVTFARTAPAVVAVEGR